MEENVNQKDKEKVEEEMIEQAFQQLLNDYLATKHRKRIEIITKAFNFANQAHKGIKRRSGEPYIMHPLAVAQIVCTEIGLGSTSICAALLHDVVEDTDYTVEDIENIFGPKIAQIVDGLTKISGGIFGDRASAQAENFKKLLLTLGGFAGFSLAIDGVLVLAKALKKSAMEQRSLLQNNCLISGWALLGMAVYELIVHHGLTAYRNNVPVTYFGGMEATVSLIWIPALLMGLIPLGIGLWMKKKAPAQ